MLGNDINMFNKFKSFLLSYDINKYNEFLNLTNKTENELNNLINNNNIAPIDWTVSIYTNEIFTKINKNHLNYLIYPIY
jgi:hypothetical protein